MPAHSQVANDNVSVAGPPVRKLIVTQFVVFFMGIFQFVSGIVGLVLYFIHGVEWTPRFATYTEYEAREWILTFYSIEIVMGLALFAAFQPYIRCLFAWAYATTLFQLLTTISFLWAFFHGSAPEFKSELIFGIGLAYHLTQVALIVALWRYYLATQDDVTGISLKATGESAGAGAVNTWPCNRVSRVPIGVIIPPQEFRMSRIPISTNPNPV